MKVQHILQNRVLILKTSKDNENPEKDITIIIDSFHYECMTFYLIRMRSDIYFEFLDIHLHHYSTLPEAHN